MGDRSLDLPVGDRWLSRLRKVVGGSSWWSQKLPLPESAGRFLAGGDQTCGIWIAAVGIMTSPAFDHRDPAIGLAAAVIELSAVPGKRPGVVISAKGSHEAHGPDSRPE